MIGQRSPMIQGLCPLLSLAMGLIVPRPLLVLRHERVQGNKAHCAKEGLLYPSFSGARESGTVVLYMMIGFRLRLINVALL